MAKMQLMNECFELVQVIRIFDDHKRLYIGARNQTGDYTITCCHFYYNEKSVDSKNLFSDSFGHSDNAFISLDFLTETSDWAPSIFEAVKQYENDN